VQSYAAGAYGKAASQHWSQHMPVMFPTSYYAYLTKMIRFYNISNGPPIDLKSTREDIDRAKAIV